jgi:hypothetical protein
LDAQARTVEAARIEIKRKVKVEGRLMPLRPGASANFDAA